MDELLLKLYIDLTVNFFLKKELPFPPSIKIVIFLKYLEKL